MYSYKGKRHIILLLYIFTGYPSKIQNQVFLITLYILDAHISEESTQNKIMTPGGILFTPTVAAASQSWEKPRNVYK